MHPTIEWPVAIDSQSFPTADEISLQIVLRKYAAIEAAYDKAHKQAVIEHKIMADKHNCNLADRWIWVRKYDFQSSDFNHATFEAECARWAVIDDTWGNAMRAMIEEERRAFFSFTSTEIDLLRKYINKLANQAYQLCLNLQDHTLEFSDDWNCPEDEMYEIERSHKRKYQATKRFVRRCNRAMRISSLISNNKANGGDQQ